MNKIAFLSLWSCPLTPVGTGKSGGMSIYIRNLAKELALLDCKIDIFTKFHSQKHEVEDLGQNIGIIHSDQIKNSYDFFYSHYYISGKIGLKVKEKFNRPLFHTFHSLFKLKEKWEKESIKRFLAEVKVAKQSDLIIASSENEKRILTKDYNADKDKIAVIPPGVDHKIFKPMDKKKARERLGLPTNKTLLLFVGRLEKIKGIDVISKAYEKLIKLNKKNIELLIIGGRKRIPYSNLSDYYGAADLLIVPSFAESFGLSALEGMASMLPIVASDIGSLSELVHDGKNGFLFKPGKADDLAEKIERLIHDKSLRKKMGHEGHKKSLGFSWEKMAKKILNLYKTKYG